MQKWPHHKRMWNEIPSSIFPTGTTIYYPENCYNSYILYDSRDGSSYLIDMNGNTVHSWPYTGYPVEMIDPAINKGIRGQIFCQKEAENIYCDTLLIVDWDAKIVWEWGDKAPEGKARQHLDLSPLPNGNILLIAQIESYLSEVPDKPVGDQAIYEVNRDGEITWKWISSQYIEDLGFIGEKKKLLFSKKMRHRNSIFVINNMAPLGSNKWYQNGDERFHPDNIMIGAREGSFLAIIEKKTGNIIWRMGPEYPSSYDYSKRTFSGDHPRPVDSICGPHDAHMIPEGLPGEGNVLVFDNQGAAGFPPIYLSWIPGSRVLEIDPITKEIVWQYDASCSGKPVWSFFSAFISSARRLPNGNTLINEGMNGRLFQVTPEGEIVWEFINPIFVFQFKSIKENSIFRAQPIPYDWVPDGMPFSEKKIIPPNYTK